MSPTAYFPALFGVWRADVPAFLRLPVAFVFYGLLRRFPQLLTYVQASPEEAGGYTKRFTLPPLLCIVIVKHLYVWVLNGRPNTRVKVSLAQKEVLKKFCLFVYAIVVCPPRLAQELLD